MTDAQSPVNRSISSLPPTEGKGLYRAGTLAYTRYGLFSMFIWMLWGDVVVTLMESLLAILPLKLEELNAVWLVPYFAITIPAAMAFILNPIISFRSDRCRTRMGRRIPYLLWSTPILSAFLILFGFSEAIGHSLYAPASRLLGFTINQNTMVLALMGLFLIGFRFGEMFVSTVYSYLFNDVIPENLFARFRSLFNLVGGLTGMAYQLWIFPKSMDYFPHIFTAIALVYLFGFLLMCTKLKEGRYPPPPENVDRKKGVVSSVKTYCKECFTHKFYWYFFLMNTCMSVSWLSGVYGLLRNKDSLHVDLPTIGRINAATGLVALLMLPALGWIADKVNPIRCFVVMGFVLAINPFIQSIFIFKDFGPTGNTWVLLAMGLVILPFDALQGTVEMPMYMRLLPRERFGQFCSANGTFRALARIILSLLVGPFMELLIRITGDKLTAYKYYPLWTVFFQVPAIICMLLLFREWKKLGGNKGYVPPQVGEVEVSR